MATTKNIPEVSLGDSRAVQTAKQPVQSRHIFLSHCGLATEKSGEIQPTTSFVVVFSWRSNPKNHLKWWVNLPSVRFLARWDWITKTTVWQCNTNAWVFGNSWNVVVGLVRWLVGCLLFTFLLACLLVCLLLTFVEHLPWQIGARPEKHLKHGKCLNLGKLICWSSRTAEIDVEYSCWWNKYS